MCIELVIEHVELHSIFEEFTCLRPGMEIISKHVTG